MIFTKTENYKLGYLKKYWTDKEKPVTVKTTTYWFLIIPVFTNEEIVDNRS